MDMGQHESGNVTHSEAGGIHAVLKGLDRAGGTTVDGTPACAGPHQPTDDHPLAPLKHEIDTDYVIIDSVYVRHAEILVVRPYAL